MVDKGLKKRCFILPLLSICGLTHLRIVADLLLRNEAKICRLKKGCMPIRKKCGTRRETCLKGQCHEIFCFWFFSWISFPPAPECSIKTVSIFFENSRRYSQLKVCHRCQRHRWQMEKIFNQKNFNNFIWSPLGSRGNIYINFCLQVHFQVSAAWYCSNYLPPVSITPVANLPPLSLIPVAICHRRRLHRRQICRRYRWHRWQICHRCQQHKGNWWENLPPVSTGGKFATSVVDTGGAP